MNLSILKAVLALYAEANRSLPALVIPLDPKQAELREKQMKRLMDKGRELGELVVKTIDKSRAEPDDRIRSILRRSVAPLPPPSEEPVKPVRKKKKAPDRKNK